LYPPTGAASFSTSSSGSNTARKSAAVQLFAPLAKDPTGTQLTGVFGRIVDELATLPGVSSVGAGSSVPLWGGDGEQEFLIEGRPAPTAGQRPTFAWFDVYPGYFETLGIPLVRGRCPTSATGPAPRTWR
jgi:hypothetical protein